jgi:hypothetical protein
MKRYVLTGLPGADKTPILRILHQRSFAVAGEAATDVISRAGPRCRRALEFRRAHRQSRRISAPQGQGPAAPMQACSARPVPLCTRHWPSTCGTRSRRSSPARPRGLRGSRCRSVRSPPSRLPAVVKRRSWHATRSADRRVLGVADFIADRGTDALFCVGTTAGHPSCSHRLSSWRCPARAASYRERPQGKGGKRTSRHSLRER